MTTRHAVTAVAASAFVALALTACGGSDERPTAAEATAHAVTIENFVFRPGTIEVAAGTRLAVSNRDDTAHTLTADDGAFDTGDIAGGATQSVVVKGSGEVAYHCDIHDYMKGVIRIVGR